MHNQPPPPSAYTWSAEDPGTPPDRTTGPSFYPTEYTPEPTAYAPTVGGGGPGTGMDRSSHARRDSLSDESGEAKKLYRFGYPEDDLPLLEELGIFPAHIRAKALSVLHPFRKMSADAIEDTDVAGPLTFAVALAFMLSLQGKLHFGAVYGLSLLAIAVAYGLLSLMTENQVRLQFVVSSLGYCLLPNVILAGIQTVQHWLFGSSPVILPFALVVIGWSGWCSAQMFVTALGMHEQRFLILYPCLLLYAAFAAITIF